MRYLKLVALMMSVTVSASATADPLYQWVDANGVITYSPEPPDSSITTNFKEISDELNSDSIHRQDNSDRPLKEAASLSDNALFDGPIGLKENESKLERMLRLAPSTPMPITSTYRSENTTTKTNTTVDLHQIRIKRKCSDLTNRMKALETRLAAIETAEQLNESILMLSRYQTMHENSCAR